MPNPYAFTREVSHSIYAPAFFPAVPVLAVGGFLEDLHNCVSLLCVESIPELPLIISNSAEGITAIVLTRGCRIESIPEFPLVVSDSAEGIVVIVLDCGHRIEFIPELLLVVSDSAEGIGAIVLTCGSHIESAPEFCSILDNRIASTWTRRDMLLPQ